MSPHGVMRIDFAPGTYDVLLKLSAFYGVSGTFTVILCTGDQFQFANTPGYTLRQVISMYGIRVHCHVIGVYDRSVRFAAQESETWVE